ncbi:MAG: TOBE domain-containing protein [Cyanobacteria bacterium J06632_22]
MLRQEALMLTPTTEGQGVVRDRLFLGREYQYRVQIQDNLTLDVRRPISQPIDVGTSVQVGLQTTQPTKLQFFPSAVQAQSDFSVPDTKPAVSL